MRRIMGEEGCGILIDTVRRKYYGKLQADVRIPQVGRRNWGKATRKREKKNVLGGRGKGGRSKGVRYGQYISTGTEVGVRVSRPDRIGQCPVQSCSVLFCSDQ